MQLSRAVRERTDSGALIYARAIAGNEGIFYRKGFAHAAFSITFPGILEA